MRAKINGFGIGWPPPIIYAKVVAIKYLPFYIDFRGAVVGKTAKTASSPGFGGIERGSRRSGSPPVIWWSCLPKILSGAPGLTYVESLKV